MSFRSVGQRRQLLRLIHLWRRVVSFIFIQLSRKSLGGSGPWIPVATQKTLIVRKCWGGSSFNYYFYRCCRPMLRCAMYKDVVLARHWRVNTFPIHKSQLLPWIRSVCVCSSNDDGIALQEGAKVFLPREIIPFWSMATRNFCKRIFLPFRFKVDFLPVPHRACCFRGEWMSE